MATYHANREYCDRPKSPPTCQGGSLTCIFSIALGYISLAVRFRAITVSVGNSSTLSINKRNKIKATAKETLSV